MRSNIIKFIYFIGCISKFLLLCSLLFVVLKRASQRKCTHGIKLGLFFFLVFGSVIGLLGSTRLSPLTDETVKITALGKKGDTSKNDEVFLSGFSVNGKSSPVGEIKDGKWFWIGDFYCWRNEQDTRQPDGVTRSITLSVPVGYTRALNFSAGKNRGLVEIEFRGKKEIIDTSIQTVYELPVSAKRALVSNECFHLFVYSMFLLFFGCISFYAVERKEKFFGWIQTYRWVLLYAGIALLQMTFAISHSQVISFWNDEMYEIGWTVQSNTIWERMMKDIVPRPIFSAFFYLWYLISPYGEKWLLLPFEIATAFGIFLTGLCGKQLRDGKTGLFAAAFVAISSVTLVNLSYEIRSYPFYFCFGAWLLLLNLKRWEHPSHETNLEIIKTAIVMTLFAGMHAHAVITVIMFFFIDFYRYCKYRIRLVNIVPYLVAAMSYIPILMVAVRSVQKGTFDDFWNSVPTIIGIIDLINFLCSNISIISWLFLFSASVNIIWFYNNVRSIRNDDQTCNKKEFRFYLFAVCVCHIVFMYIYGNINTNATFWHNRYFLGLIPIILNLGADAASGLCDWINEKGKNTSLSSIAALFVLLIIFHAGYKNLPPKQIALKDRFREAGDWLYEQDSIYDSDTIIIGVCNNVKFAGWNEYYLMQQGKRDAINAVPQSQKNLKNELENYGHVYVAAFHASSLSRSLQKILDTKYTLVQSSKDVPVKEYIRK